MLVISYCLRDSEYGVASCHEQFRCRYPGADVGLLQSVRESLLSFTVLFLLLIFSEQQVAVLSVAALGLGVAITGYLPSIYGFYFSTTLMSVGFQSRSSE